MCQNYVVEVVEAILMQRWMVHHCQRVNYLFLSRSPHMDSVFFAGCSASVCQIRRYQRNTQNDNSIQDRFYLERPTSRESAQGRPNWQQTVLILAPAFRRVPPSDMATRARRRVLDPHFSSAFMRLASYCNDSDYFSDCTHNTCQRFS
jgi:hypothetical protein